MDKPGLPRATMIGIIGFLIGVTIVLVVRGLQQMDPLWNAEIGLVLSTFTSMFGFVYGMGALDPRMNVHGDHAEEKDHEDDDQGEFDLERRGWFHAAGDLFFHVAEYVVNLAPQPDIVMHGGFFLIRWIVNLAVLFLIVLIGLILISISLVFLLVSLLGYGLGYLARMVTSYSHPVWQVSAIAVVLTVILFALALFPHGFRIEISNDPNASFAQTGYSMMQLPFGGPEVELSQFTVLVIFILFMLFSLAIATAIIALLMYTLSKGVKEVKGIEPSEEDLTPPDAIQAVGRFHGWVAGLLRGLPRVLGYK